MGSAQLDTASLDPAFADATGDLRAAAGSAQAAPHGNAQAAPTEALRRQVAERLAAHRLRRLPAQPTTDLSPSPSAPARSARIAAAVARRYAQSPSYRAYLAAEAERATQQAQAAAEIAALNAQAIAQAQQQLLDDLRRDQPNQYEPNQVDLSQGFLDRDASGPEPDHPPAYALSASNAFRQVPQQDRDDAEAYALDDEIAFRQSPVFEEHASAPVPLSANLIEFPRQLVAPRKARPRYAEGPLRAADGTSPAGGQLRIFEVDPAQISTTPVAADAIPTAQWTSLWLDGPGPGHEDASYAHRPAADPSADAEAVAGAVPLPQIASIVRRLMAVAMDASIVLAGFLAAAALLLAVCHASARQPAAALPPNLPNLNLHLGLAHAAAQSVGQSVAQSVAPIASQIATYTGLQPRVALVASALALVLLFLLYQSLFFSFSDSTLGMRAVRIALCTFDDENPTRPALRRRILALLVSACPLGLGLFWAVFDEDRLAWHDRLSQTYQRSY